MNEKDRSALNEAVETLDGLTGGDPEASHGLADGALTDLLRAVGFGEAADAFDEASERVGFWY